MMEKLDNVPKDTLWFPSNSHFLNSKMPINIKSTDTQLFETDHNILFCWCKLKKQPLSSFLEALELAKAHKATASKSSSSSSIFQLVIYFERSEKHKDLNMGRSSRITSRKGKLSPVRSQLAFLKKLCKRQALKVVDSLSMDSPEMWKIFPSGSS